MSNRLIPRVLTGITLLATFIVGGPPCNITTEIVPDRNLPIESSMIGTVYQEGGYRIILDPDGYVIGKAWVW
jgi:hypothetical protein